MKNSTFNTLVLSSLFIILCMAIGMTVAIFSLPISTIKSDYSYRNTEGTPCKTKECKNDYNFTLQSNGYSGWQMGCNFVGSPEERKEQKKYLDCANGMVYELIGESMSTTYFNPRDEEINNKYCPEGGVATFTHDDPITKKKGGQFSDCLNW